LGGGVFGPAIKLIPAIKEEAAKWAQPISITQVSIEPSALGNDAGVFGAGFLALKNNNR
jgi:glucokinase